MPKVDIEKFIEQSGVRRTRFGGLEETDVHAAMEALCREYEQRLSRSEGEVRRLTQENASLEQQCHMLAGQNRTLSGQNAKLAGNSEHYARQSQELDTQLFSLRERNHSLNDQIAVLRLKNGDLTREAAELRDHAQQAETALRIRGEELEQERAALAAARQKKLDEAQAQADAALAQAREQAEAIVAAANGQAAAIDRAAREQARRQAQQLVDAAAAEANEIQNAHQLRLNSLANELRRLESRRDQMLEFLDKVGQALLRAREEAVAADPADKPEFVDPPVEEVPLTLEPQPTPQAELDLSPDILAAAAETVRAEAVRQAAEKALAEQQTPPAPAAPAPDLREPPAARPTFTLAEEEELPVAGDDLFPELPEPADEPEPEAGTSTVRQTGPALTEVPGAIFSSPIVRRADEPLQEAPPPVAGPHEPVLPELQVEESFDTTLEVTEPDDPVAAARQRQRRKAVWAVGALHRMYSITGGGTRP